MKSERFRHQCEDNAMRKTLSPSPVLDDLLLQESAAKAYVEIPPVTGANAIHVMFTPTRGPAGNAREIVKENVGCLKWKLLLRLQPQIFNGSQ